MRKFLSFRSRHLHDRTLKPSSNAVASSPSDGGKPHREDALYEYEYLPEGYIRILELLPGALEDPLRCKLVPVKLSEAPNYAAISYVWGDNSVTDVLHIGDKILRITLNLRDALTRLRFQHRPLSLWADAVCINQRNLAEKTHQVQIMGLIYYRASLVNVWLGNLSTDEQTGVETALECMARLISLYRADMEMFGNDVPRYSSKTLMFPDELPWSEWQSWVDHSGWEALRLLFERAWFKRVWVVQEVGLAKDVLYLFGRSGKLGFNRDDLRLLMEWFEISGDVVARYFEIDMRQYRLVNRYLDCTRGESGGQRSVAEGVDFLDVLDEARGFQCSNPLDTVYAFLGHPAAFNARFNSVLQDMDYERMAGERSTIVLPDYDTKLFALYRNLALAVINGVDSGSDLLRYVAHADEESLYSDPLPNWVPRWDISAVPRAFAPPASVYYNASGSLPRHPLKVIDKTYLRMKAIRIDTITFSWTFLDSSWFFIWGTKFKYSVIANGQAISNEDSNPVEYLWAAFEKRRASLPNGHLNDIVAYCTTLTAGLTGNAKPVGSNSRSHFANFCAYRLAKAERWGIPQLPPGTRAQLEEDSKEGDADQYFCDVERACGNRAFFCTEKGYIGLGPRVMGDEDEVWLPMGSMVPFVLRSTYGRHGDCYRVLGQAYVHGFMEGEAVRDLEEDDFQEIVLC